MFYQNLQVSNNRRLSKYPFSQNSTLLIGNYTFPVRLIKSLSVQILSAVFPIHINKIYTNKDIVYLQAVDKNAQQQVTIQITDSNVKIYNKNKIIAGNMAYSSQLYRWLLSMLKQTVGGYTEIDSQALILDGSVIHCVAYNGYTGMSVNGKYIGQTVGLNFQRNIKTTIQNQNIRLDIYGDYTFPYQNKKKLQYVNGIELKNKILQIKSRALSNLRVATQQNKISLIGVTDVT